MSSDKKGNGPMYTSAKPNSGRQSNEVKRRKMIGWVMASGRDSAD